jgi:hypothetical protein
MRRRLLDLCLLAYPRARRKADRDYLRDLALDFAETQGLLRQAWSLLSGGLAERIEVRRRRPGVSLGGWVNRVVGASFVLAAFAVAAHGPIVAEGGDSEVERFVCQNAEDPPSKRNPGPTNGGTGCAGTQRLIAGRERAGWDCTTRKHTRSDAQTTSWRCTRG